MYKNYQGSSPYSFNQLGNNSSTIKTYQQYDQDVMIQEGLDIQEELIKWIEDTQYKLQNIEYIHTDAPKTPHISHVVYFTNSVAPKSIKPIAITKAIETAYQFNNVDTDYKHYFWTNDKEVVPKEIKNIPNLEIRIINEFKDHILWDSLNNILNKAQSKSEFFVQASDVFRLMAVQKYGGIYHDLDYAVYNSEELIKITDNFNFVNAREFDGRDNACIGNAFVAAAKNNSIINKALESCYRNLNQEQYDDILPYLQYPLNGVDKMLFETGPVMITMAYYSARDASRNEGSTDIILPPKMIYHYEYARAVTPGYNNDVYAYDITKDNLNGLSLVNEFYGLEINTLGGDMFTGSWSVNLLDPIDYGSEL